MSPSPVVTDGGLMVLHPPTAGSLPRTDATQKHDNTSGCRGNAPFVQTQNENLLQSDCSR
ncbi:hypothetical protein Rmet_6589 [Cupriavidus metallidurans CH34]|uniref:Uncharacterized protein n=1 Tax=Cupriavidus metallidurans (strain ATCC 43123 / DSM 2839 / NBRC 102507 / CH34) TaxID=266264 RepID=D3DY20_CUPMC|nr:hypothetical protein Rmet_6589 [Cupriavidus metallidurans CH34]